MSHELIYGLQVTVIGMGIVFLILYIISLMLDIMRPLFYRPAKKQEPAPAQAAKQPKAAPKTTPGQEKQEHTITAAIIAAAISAASGIPKSKLKIKSIRREAEGIPAWSMAARMSTPASRHK